MTPLSDALALAAHRLFPVNRHGRESDADADDSFPWADTDGRVLLTMTTLSRERTRMGGRC